MKHLVLPLALVGMLAVGCSEEKGPKGGEENTPRHEIPTTRAEREVIDANNEFAQKLMGKLAEGDSYADGNAPANFVVSPLSLSMALSMTATGAEGSTREEILDVLGFDDLEAANALNRKLKESLPSMDNRTTVKLANAMWFENGTESNIRPEFSETLAACYDATMNLVEGLGKENGMKLINDWSATHTDNMIPRLLDQPLGDNTVMALTNALYFKGKWTHEFSKEDTQKERFYNLDGSTKDVDMMNARSMAVQAYEDKEAGYKAASLSYGNSAYSMIVVVPEFGRNPAEALASIDPEDLAKLARRESYETSINLKLPCFTVENGTELIPALKKLGIKEMFLPGCDFSGMWKVSDGDFLISKVYQGAKICVDEQGAEAAAVTIITGECTSPGPVESTNFYVDRPFAFAIAEQSTGVILFAGVVTHL